MLRAGADKVSLNTAAVNDPDIVRAGARGVRRAVHRRRDRRPRRARRRRGWEVVTHGGRTPTGLDAVEWAERVCALGAGEILLTSMDRDGTKAGYDIELLQAMGDAVDVPDHRERRRRHARAPLRGRGRGRRRARCSRRRSSTSASITVREAKADLAARGLIVRP